MDHRKREEIHQWLLAIPAALSKSLEQVICTCLNSRWVRLSVCVPAWVGLIGLWEYLAWKSGHRHRRPFCVPCIDDVCVEKTSLKCGDSVRYLYPQPLISSRGHPLGQCFRHPISSFVFLSPKLCTFGRCFSLTNRIFGEYCRPLASFWTVFLSLNLIFGQIIRGSPDFTFFWTVFQFPNLTFLQYSSTYPYLSTVFRFSNLPVPFSFGHYFLDPGLHFGYHNFHFGHISIFILLFEQSWILSRANLHLLRFWQIRLPLHPPPPTLPPRKAVWRLPSVWPPLRRIPGRQKAKGRNVYNFIRIFIILN
jgi:hypothetical protein